MKRIGNLYQNIYKFENIVNAYNEVCRNTKNKRKVENLKEYKTIYISRIYNILKNKSYTVGPYNTFTIYEPKERIISSQNVQDKIINHLVSRYILYPAILPCLIDVNVASRKNMGTSKGIDLSLKFHKKCKIKYDHYYILKCDISKFFYSINHDNLKQIQIFLHKEGLRLNNKTRIYKNTNNFIFLGRDKMGNYSHYRNVKRKLKSKIYLYLNNKVSLQSLSSSFICYKGLCDKNFSTFLN